MSWQRREYELKHGGDAREKFETRERKIERETDKRHGEEREKDIRPEEGTAIDG